MSRLGVVARRLVGAFVVFSLALGLAGCGYSEDEMRAKMAEIERLQKELAAEQAQNQKAQGELNDARANIEQLKLQLKSLGVDLAKSTKEAEELGRALEEYKRRAAQLEEIRKRFELLRNKLQELTKLGLNVTVRNNRMVIQLPGDVLFDTGRDKLRREGEEILAKVAAVIRNDPELLSRQFQVAGHTDNTPLRAGVYKDNWGLSVMRAREVLTFLIRPEADGGGGLPEKRWSAAGYGDTDPVDTNDSVDGRQRNRRCELVVLPNVEEMLDLNTLIK